MKDQRNVLLNAMNLYNGISKIINLFENKNIEPGDCPHDAKLKLEPDLKSEPLFEESIPERTKMKRQKNSDKENQEGQ